MHSDDRLIASAFIIASSERHAFRTRLIRHPRSRAGRCGTAEADAVFMSTDQNISRFANSNVHQNMSEISAELTLRVIVDGRDGRRIDDRHSTTTRSRARRRWRARRRGTPIRCRTSAASIATNEPLPDRPHVRRRDREHRAGGEGARASHDVRPRPRSTASISPAPTAPARRRSPARTRTASAATAR